MVHPLHEKASMQWHLPLMTVCNLIQTIQQLCGDIQGADLVSDDKLPATWAIRAVVEDGVP